VKTFLSPPPLSCLEIKIRFFFSLSLTFLTGFLTVYSFLSWLWRRLACVFRKGFRLPSDCHFAWLLAFWFCYAFYGSLVLIRDAVPFPFGGFEPISPGSTSEEFISPLPKGPVVLAYVDPVPPPSFSRSLATVLFFWVSLFPRESLTSVLWSLKGRPGSR